MSNVIFLTKERLAAARRRRNQRRRAEAQRDVAAARLAISVMEGDPCDLEALATEAQLALRLAAELAAAMGMPTVASAFRRAVEAIRPDVTPDGLIDVRRFVDGDERDNVVAALVDGVHQIEEAVR
jgi:hypothetical protein